jgi:3-oxoacyl-[acyl-carrier-protein] synthase-3
MPPPTSVVLTGSGCSLPRRAMTNDEFTATIDTSDEWIRTRTGIRERRVAGPGETTASLGIDASRRALVAAGLAPPDIDLIVCATVTPDLMTPAVAHVIQAGLGCRPVGAFDLNAACSGFVYAVGVAEQFLRTGACRHVLVVGADTLTRIIDYSDRNSCILFGDGAGAVVLSGSDRPDAGVRSVRLYSDGTRSNLIQVPSATTPKVPLAEGDVRHPEYLRMNGREVFRFAVTRMIQLIDDAMVECQQWGGEIDLLIPHQVNQRIIDAALDHTAFPADRVMVNLDRYGNTSAASVPIALDEAIRTGRAKPGDTVLLVAFGGGLTWSSALVTL